MLSQRKVMITRRRRRRIQEFEPRYFAFLGWVTMSFVATILVFIMTVIGSIIGGVYSVYASFAVDLPDPTAIETEQISFETSKLYDRSGKVVLYELFDQRLGDRSYVTLDQVPELCRQSVLVLEDKNFYTNPGFDIEGLGRAFYFNLQGKDIQGGSSITQQLIKNIIIEKEERTKKLYSRKIKEVILAIEITRLYQKNQILEWYFNTNHYGSLAYGIEAAAQVYFQKTVSELTLPECTMLTPIPQYPALNPVNNWEQAKKRQGIALMRLVEEEVITLDEAREAFAFELEIKPVQERFDIVVPHFAIHARDEVLNLMRELYGFSEGSRLLYRGGLKIYTTVDLELQNAAREIARNQITQLQENEHNASNACVVSIRPKTGEILALVGSIDYWDEENDGNVNVCTVDPGRQPGSSFKPFNYMTAIERGFVTPATMIMDVRQSFPDDPNPPYVPENYDRKYHGAVRMRNALARSYNIPAVWVMQKSGVKNVIDTAHRMGITTLDEDYYGLALTLGGGEVKPIDMAYAFSVFANHGAMAGRLIPAENVQPGKRKLNPVSILLVEDSEGKTLYEYSQPSTEQIIDPALAYLMTSILSDDEARAPAFGAWSDLTLSDRPVGAKTGTTNNFRDNWTIGYTPQLATGVWVGNNDNTPMEDVTGLSGAAPIWNKVMQFYHKDLPVKSWGERPAGIVDEVVDSVSGMLPGKYTQSTVKELFLEPFVPTQKDNVHQVFPINKTNNKLAVAGCTPPEYIEYRVYQIFPPVANDWVKNRISQPPHEYDYNCAGGVATGTVSIIHPRSFQYVRGSVVISGSVNIDNFQAYRLTYGKGLNPTGWTQIGTDFMSPVQNSALGTWQTYGLAEGLYTLQLTAVRNDNTIGSFTTQVTIDNTSPSAEVINPRDGQVYVSDDDEYVNLQVDAADNFAMRRVVYIVNNTYIGQTTVAPFTYRWTVPTLPKPLDKSSNYTKTYTIYVTASDQAGNGVKSKKVEIKVIPDLEED